MKKYSTLFLIVILALVFSACFNENSTSKTINGVEQDVIGVPAANQKSGTTTKSGLITKAGGKFFLTELGDAPKEIESYEVALDDYVDQNITVMGKYSGDTLFVGSVE